jgi:hypothetical protein
MATSCEAHPFEIATDTCKTCNYDYCPECLVYPHGERKPPYCVPCALTAAGVRSTAARSPRREMPRRLTRQRGHSRAAGNVAIWVAGAVAAGGSAVAVVLA